jgi:predicted RNase H-like nuclease (RuvC/YqgF family)
MTLAEIARQLNTSTMTVYRRLDKAGVKIADLRDADTGEVTAEGLAVIGGLFNTTGATQPTTDTTTSSATRTQHTTQRDAQQVEVEAAVLRERCKALEDTVQRLDAECERLRQQVDTLTQMLQTEQRQRVLLLDDGRQRRGLFGWFRRNRDGGE